MKRSADSPVNHHHTSHHTRRASVWLLGVWLLAGAQLWAQTSCGNYTPVGNSCQRYVTFPWFAAGANWTSQIPIFVKPGTASTIHVQLGIGTGAVLGLFSAPAFQSLYGGTKGIYDYFSTAQFDLTGGTSARFDVLSGAICAGNRCTQSPNLAVGALWLKLTAPDAASLEAATTQLIYLNGPVGAADTSQVAVPPVYDDRASAKWMTTFSETPLDTKAGNPNSGNMAFAVTNLSSQPQSVTISIYDFYGDLLAQKSTPVLQGGAPGDVYADSFGNFFGLSTALVANATALSVANLTGTVDGTIIFQSSAGQPIAPLVLRSAGNSNTMMLVTPIQ